MLNKVPLGGKNRPKIIIFLYRCFVVVYYACIVCTLLKGVSHYDLSVPSMSVMFPKKTIWLGRGGGV